MSGINFDKYFEETKIKERRKKKLYKSLLGEIEKLINEKLINEKYIVYEIPVISLEEDSYTFLGAIDYIIEKLTKNDNFKKIIVDIEILKPNHLYIQWDIKQLSTNKKFNKKNN